VSALQWLVVARLTQHPLDASLQLGVGEAMVARPVLFAGSSVCRRAAAELWDVNGGVDHHVGTREYLVELVLERPTARMVAAREQSVLVPLDESPLGGHVDRGRQLRDEEDLV